MNLLAANEHIRQSVVRDGSSAFSSPMGGDSEANHVQVDTWKALFCVSNAESTHLDLQDEDFISQPPGESAFVDLPTETLSCATSRVLDWPGVIAWNGRSTLFVPCSESDATKILLTIRKTPANASDVVIQRLTAPMTRQSELSPRPLIVHLSDLHLGAAAAGNRQIRLIQRIRKVLESYSGAEKICVISGDVVNTPSSENFSTAVALISELEQYFDHRAVVAYGNHDVNWSGLAPVGRNATRPLYSERIRYFPRSRLCIITFDSVRESDCLARGSIGRTQLDEIAHALSAMDAGQRSFRRIAVLHHHPYSVPRPRWLAPAWYERFVPQPIFTVTDRMRDADEFLEWCRSHDIALVLHGHKHIPHLRTHERPRAIGAGSSTGMMTGSTGETYVTSVNLLSVSHDLTHFSVEMLVELNDGSVTQLNQGKNLLFDVF